MMPVDPNLLRLAPDSRGAVAGLAVLAAASGLAAIAQAFAVAGLVVAVVRAEPLVEPAVWLLLAFAVRGVFSGATEVVAARAGADVSSELRGRLAAASLRQDARSRTDQGRALTLLNQGATSVEPYVARYLPALVASAVLPAAAVVAMAMLDLGTALIPVLTLPLLPLFAALIGATTRDATQRRWRALDGLSGHFLDVMKGLPTLVNYGRAHRQSATIRRVSDEHRVATVETLRLAFLSSAALEFLATISVAIVAVWTGLALAEGRMELPVALTLILLAPEAYWPIRRVGAEFHNAADGAAALADIARLLDEADDAGEPARTASPVLVAQDVSYRYADDLPLVVDGFDLRAGTGLVVLTGASGAGKTTILEILAGLRAPTSGRVQGPATHLVTQRPFLAPASLRDNLLLGSGSHGDDALRDVLDRVGLTGLLLELPDGLDTPLGEDGFGASAGQRSRLALARALLADAPLLLLDEPTAHLDAASEELVGRIVRSVADERIVVAVSHRSGLVRLADEVVEVTTLARSAR